MSMYREPNRIIIPCDITQEAHKKTFMLTYLFIDILCQFGEFAVKREGTHESVCAVMQLGDHLTLVLLLSVLEDTLHIAVDIQYSDGSALYNQ